MSFVICCALCANVLKVLDHFDEGWIQYFRIGALNRHGTGVQQRIFVGVGMVDHWLQLVAPIASIASQKSAPGRKA